MTPQPMQQQWLACGNNDLDRGQQPSQDHHHHHHHHQCRQQQQQRQQRRQQPLLRRHQHLRLDNLRHPVPWLLLTADWITRVSAACEDTCSEHGRCSDDGKCVCRSVWDGPNCDDDRHFWGTEHILFVAMILCLSVAAMAWALVITHRRLTKKSPQPNWQLIKTDPVISVMSVFVIYLCHFTMVCVNPYWETPVPFSSYGATVAYRVLSAVARLGDMFAYLYLARFWSVTTRKAMRLSLANKARSPLWFKAASAIVIAASISGVILTEIPSTQSIGELLNANVGNFVWLTCASIVGIYGIILLRILKKFRENRQLRVKIRKFIMWYFAITAFGLAILGSPTNEDLRGPDRLWISTLASFSMEYFFMLLVLKFFHVRKPVYASDEDAALPSAKSLKQVASPKQVAPSVCSSDQASSKSEERAAVEAEAVETGSSPGPASDSVVDDAAALVVDNDT